MGDNDIEYHPRKAVKGQALVEFLDEIVDREDESVDENTKQTQEETPPDTWTMYVDGSSVMG